MITAASLLLFSFLETLQKLITTDCYRNLHPTAKMLSGYARTLIKVSLDSAYYFGCIPFNSTSDPQNKSFKSSPFRKTLNYFNIVIHFLYPVHLFNNVFKIFLIRDTLPSRVFAGLLLKNLFYAGAYSIAVHYRVHQLLHLKHLRTLVLSYFSFYNVFNGEPVKKRSNTGSITLILFIIVILTFQNVTLMIKSPESPQILTSLLPNPKSAPWYVINPVKILYLYFNLSGWNWCLHTLIAYVFGYLTCCCKMLEEMTAHPSPKAYKKIRSMQVLHRFWESLFRSFFLPGFMTLWVCLVLMGSYGIVKFGGIGAVKMGAGAVYSFAYLFTVFGLSGQLNETSGRFLNQWKFRYKPANFQFHKRFVNSVLGFRVQVGNAFFVEKETILKIGNTIVTATVTLVLM